MDCADRDLTWGIIACAMMFVRGPMSFYVLRFLLGAAEAGAFPGIVFYLSQWFPEQQRASAMSTLHGEHSARRARSADHSAARCCR